MLIASGCLWYYYWWIQSTHAERHVCAIHAPNSFSNLSKKCNTQTRAEKKCVGLRMQTVARSFSWTSCHLWRALTHFCCKALKRRFRTLRAQCCWIRTKRRRIWSSREQIKLTSISDQREMFRRCLFSKSVVSCRAIYFEIYRRICDQEKVILRSNASRQRPLIAKLTIACRCTTLITNPLL